MLQIQNKYVSYLFSRLWVSPYVSSKSTSTLVFVVLRSDFMNPVCAAVGFLHAFGAFRRNLSSCMRYFCMLKQDLKQGQDSYAALA